jgi:hypothetical protein
MTTTAIQYERPASYELLTHDQSTRDGLMNKDYQSNDWHCLAAGDPPQLTLCDWVFAADTYTERGTGTWYRGSNAGGFSTEQGVFVSDPGRTYWKVVDPQPLLQFITQP